MAVTADIADAVVAYLNTLSLGVTAERANSWYHELETDAVLHLVVVPIESTVTDETRGDLRRAIRIAVIIQQKLAGMGSMTQYRDRQDVLINLSETVEKNLYGRRMSTFSFLETDGSGPRLLIDTANFAQSGIFRTEVQLTYVGDM